MLSFQPFNEKQVLYVPFRTQCISFDVKLVKRVGLTVHYLLKLQNMYELYGTFGNSLHLAGIHLFHRIRTMFDQKRSFSNANSIRHMKLPLS
jgi:hypothetical protein